MRSNTRFTRHVEAAELGVGDVEQRDALDVVDERPRADDLEEARDDVDAHAAVGAGAHHAQEVVVAGARERDDHAVDALLRHDRVEVAQGADHRQRRAHVAVVPRLAVVEEADEVDAVLGVAGDLGGHGVADLAGPDDQHPLLERGPRPDRDPADPAGQRDHQDRDEPVGDEGCDRRLRARASSTNTMRSTQLAAVSAVRPARPSPRLKPPTLRAGSRYRP